MALKPDLIKKKKKEGANSIQVYLQTRPVPMSVTTDDLVCKCPYSACVCLLLLSCDFLHGC